MTTNSIGEEGFRWFIGVVEDRNDPEKLGRVRIRAYNIHGTKTEAPTSTLPWATVLMPGYSASLKEVGQSPTGLQVGSTVVGFFIDGNETNIPVIFGVLPGKGDISLLAAEQNRLDKQTIGPEPQSAYGSKYPFNKVFKSESGHAFEIDDTPNAERLHTFHRSGTYTEVDYSGRRVNKIVGDDYEIVQKNQTIFIQGNVDIKVKGSYTLDVDGPVVINGSTVNINHGTQGAARVGDPAEAQDNTDDVGGSPFVNNTIDKIQSGSKTVFIGD